MSDSPCASRDIVPGHVNKDSASDVSRERMRPTARTSRASRM